jgi:citrate lyase subunit beta / citryl-CoA lyase
VSTGTVPVAGVRRGEAGRRGADVRSDLYVVVEEGGAGLELELQSRVASLSGDRIRDTVAATLRSLGIERARVAVEDAGAVPWVIEARVEAAARAAALVPVTEGSPPAAPAGAATRRASAGTAHDRLRRSRLYLPGNEPKYMLNAGLHQPDGVILDLEDSVHPDAKPMARVLVRNALRHVDFGGAERMVRINQLPLGLEDLDEVVPERPDLVLIPKVERPAQVAEVADRIARIIGPDRPTVWIMPILESALGIENAFAIATASTSVAALTIGLEDYTADLGVVKTAEGAETLWARNRVVNAARAAGVQAIDSVYGDVQDDEGLRAWGLAARAMGFIGMGCVHPRQIRIIHDTFAPTPPEIERALRIVDAFREADARGLGVVSLGSKMIDPPVVLRARRLVERARDMGLLDGGER